MPWGERMGSSTALRRLLAVVVAVFLTLAGLLAPVTPAQAATKPKVTGISITSGNLQGGETLTIRGTGFKKVKRVLFGTVRATNVKVKSSKRITVTVPPGQAGVVDVRVVTKKGTSKRTTRAKYRYLAAEPAPVPSAAPTVSGIAPALGSVSGGTVVKLTGSRFAGATQVLFGSRPGTGLVVASDSAITVTTPSGVQGAVVVKVVGPGGTSAGTSFVYQLVDTMSAGQRLSAGQSLSSSNGGYRLTMQADCNLVVYTSAGAAKWGSSTNRNDAGCHADVLADGNLVIYTSGGQAVWASNTGGFNGAALRMQDDGNLVIYQNSRAIWTKGDGVLYDRLLVNQTLKTDQKLVSPNRQYALIMQGDGNLVVYASGGAAQWASNTTNGSGNWLVMQDDGNLVIYTSANKPVWASSTSGKSGAILRVQDDGNLVIYHGSAAVWSSKGGSGKVSSFKAWALNSANWNSTTRIYDAAGNIVGGGKPGIDADGAFGAQCADLGIAWSGQAGHRVGFDGWDSSTAGKAGWHFVSGNLSQVQPGDVVTRVGGKQHVVVVTGSPSGGSVEVIQQNPGSPAVASYSTSTSGVIWRLN